MTKIRRYIFIAGTPVLCCIVAQISTNRGLRATGFSSKTSSEDVDQGNPDSLERLKQMLEMAWQKADEKEREAERMRRALAYLNYSSKMKIKFSRKNRI